ncbi:TPM domain-containing protein [Anaerobacillus alkaliphilus]|uniref:TPM domain-containing protein n=1 Tax=Anaerobacillus alkaliphilus TaxID=1548597 RepID=UPI00137558C4|nr:TPM domain-containing protein [Anaerobacillus alkaliphilus]
MKKWLLFILIFLLLPIEALAAPQKIFDYAELLTPDEVSQLESLATTYSDQHRVDIIVLTTNQTDGKSIEQYMGDFVDEQGYDDTVIITIDMLERDVMVAGFGKGEKYVDNYRGDIILEEITPYLSDGNFFGAFREFIEQANYYLGVEPEVRSTPNPSPNPSPGYNSDVNYNRNYQPAQDNIFFELWFQLLASVVVGGVTVGIMGYYSSGRKTTNARTYLDVGRSAVTASYDRFVRKTVTKTKKPSSNNKGGGGGFGGGGGGGFTGGGRSFSGSKGKF